MAGQPAFNGRPERSIPSSAKPGSSEWQRWLTIEERQHIRQKIRQAYVQTCPTYQELLGCVVAIEEEFLHISAPSRLDYFKSGVQYDKRVIKKRKELNGQVQGTEGGPMSSLTDIEGKDGKDPGNINEDHEDKKRRKN
ncbi:unnamed protein product [Choristocarpus tenellus]